MSTNDILNGLPKLQNRVNSDTESYVDKVVKDAKNSRYAGLMTYPFVTERQDNYAKKNENEDWFYATSGCQHVTVGTITVCPDDNYTYKYQMHTTDRYNWDGNKKTGTGPPTVTDKQLQELHHAGQPRSTISLANPLSGPGHDTPTEPSHTHNYYNHHAA